LCNFIGGFFFLVSGVAGVCGAEGQLEQDLVNLPYFVGSILFAVGGIFSLWMWKCEQYGLGALPELNIKKRSPRTVCVRAAEETFPGCDIEVGQISSPASICERVRHAVPDTEEIESKLLSMHSEYGCGKASAWQLPWLTLYIVNATASVLDISMSICIDGNRSDFARVMQSFLNFALSHGILLLGSVIHHVPTARPHNWLLIYMRGVLLMYTVVAWHGSIAHLGELFVEDPSH